MSIAQQIMANPGKYSIEQLQHALDSGIVPAYIAIPLIQEKTQQQQQMQMASQGAGAPQEDQPTIAQEVLSQADQASGIPQLQSGLPPQGYAPGGIVAFEHGGDVRHFAAGGTDEEDDDKEYESTPAGLLSLVSKSIRGAAVKPDIKSAIEAVQGFRTTKEGTATKAIDDYITQQAETAPSRAQQQRAYRILELAGRLGAGKSPYGIMNLGEAIAGVAPGLAQDEQAQEKERLQNLMLQSQLEQQRRAAESADITAGISLYGHEADLSRGQASALARLATAAGKLGQPPKETDLRFGALRYAKPYARTKFGKPYEELTDAEREQADAFGIQRYQQEQGQAFLGRQASLLGAGAQQTQAGIAAQRAGQEALDDATRRVDDAIKTRNHPIRQAQSALKNWGQENNLNPAQVATLTFNFRQRLIDAGAKGQELDPQALIEELKRSAVAPKTTATPSAGAKTAAPQPPSYGNIKGAPKGGSIGKYVADKGYEVLDAQGKLVGYTNPKR